MSEFMIGLEKMKARSGEVSQSACALMREDMHQLYDYCMDSTQMPEESRWAVHHEKGYWLFMVIYLFLCLNSI